MASVNQISAPNLTFFFLLLVVCFVCLSKVDANLLVDPAKIGKELQSFAKDALGVDEMQKHFDSLEYREQPIKGDNIVPLAAKFRERFTTRFNIAERLKKAVEEAYSRTANTSPWKECCKIDKSTLVYDVRFRSKVDLNSICVKISGSAPKNPAHLDSGVFKEIKAISDEHSFIKWIYFASEEGVMTNFPTYDDPVKCDGYDPRFRPFYVETATPEAKDVVLVMDTSSSMTGDKLDVAKEAAKTVLDTMNPKDHVGIVSFVGDAKTPTSETCYSEKLALAIPTNIRNLKDFVDNRHTFQGRTKFIPAFEKAFELLKGSASEDSGKNKKRVILFLTDGDPTDSKKTLFETIRNRNLELNNSVIILTYGFDLGYQEILIDIARQNTSKYGVPANYSVGDIALGSYTFVEDMRTLRSKMATYYDLFAEQLSRPVVSVPYVDAFGTGLLVSVTVACYHQGKFIGVAGTDINMEDLMPDITEYYKQGRTTYAFMTTKSGRTLIHPLLPAPADAYGDPIYMDIRNLERPESEFKSIFDSMSKGMSGNKSLSATRYLPRGGSIKEGVTETHITSTYYWRPVQGTEFSLGVVIPVSLENDVLDTLQIPDDYTFNYHRIDLAPSERTCLYFGKLATKDTTVVTFAPDAYLDPYEYFGTDETEVSVRLLTDYMMGRKGSEAYSKLRRDIRDTVIATWKLEDVWLRDKTKHTQYLIWRYIGTANGVFRETPGDVLAKGFDPRKRPWYYTALSHSGFLTLTTPYLDISGAGVVITAARALHRGESSQIHQTNDEVLGVMGADFPLRYFYRLLTEVYPRCGEIQTYSCFVMDSAGFLVMHEDFMDPSADKHVVEHVHITEKEKQIAQDMISNGYLVKKDCRNLDDIEKQTFYEVHLPSGRVDALGNVGSCTKYQLGKIEGTNVYLGISVRDQVCPAGGCTCSSDKQCNQFLSCECPCTSPLEFHYCRGEFPNSSLPICPALAPDQSQDLPSSPRKGCPEIEKCFDPHCQEKDSRQTCDGIVSCYWCEKDKDNVILSNPYCGSAEQCFRGRETPVTEADGQVDEPKCGPTGTEASSPESGGLSTGAVVGISIGSIILVVIIVAALYWGIQRYRRMIGPPVRQGRTPSTQRMVENQQGDHPMSSQNPLGHQYEDPDQITPWPAPYNEIRSRPTGKPPMVPEAAQANDAQPEIRKKRTYSRPTNPPPPIPTTTRPSGAVASLALGIFQIGDSQLPITVKRKPSADSDGVIATQQLQEHHGNPPPLVPRARRPSEMGDPSVPLPDTTSQPPISKKRESPYGNVQSSIAKTSVETRNGEDAEGVDDHGYLKCIHTTVVPEETQ
ncbi:hypothetical protein ACROYT_G034408 [Oculina patagonica]